MQSLVGTVNQLFHNNISTNLNTDSVKMTQKLSLKWDDFNGNASKAFGLMRDEDMLQDVTLVGDDNSQIAAHKLVLSACSEYFKSIFKKNKHTHLLLCLEGVTSSEIMNLLDYMYNGEVNIFQEELDRFLIVAKRFKLEGLLGKKEEHYIHSKSRDVLVKEENPDPLVHEESSESQEPSLSSFVETLKVSMTDEQKNDLIETVNQYLEKAEDGTWKCTLCENFLDKKYKHHVQNHVETKHLEGISLPCKLCGKICRSRKALAYHHRNHK